MSDFTAFYGLHFNPFDKQTVKAQDHFESRDFQEMTARLEHLQQIRGLGVFTARPGMGKTFALRCFAENLNPNLSQMIYLCLSTVSVSEFYKQLCDVLGLQTKGRKNDQFTAIQQQIQYMYEKQKCPLILAIDEAQYLNTSILNDLKMLMNYRYDSLKCFTLVLCGESYLNHTLMKPVHESLRQRITVHYDFKGLSDEEISRYIRHKLSLAGGAPSVINDEALASVHSLSQGNPRIIDEVMTDALTIGAQQKRQTIDTEIIVAAAANRRLA